jgi:hypothetical protein
MPVLVAADQKSQSDFDRNVKNDAMLHCGGYVMDEAGKPIGGVRVRLMFDMPGYMSRWVRDAMTDEQGRWHRPLPPECIDLSVSFEHPEYYLDESRIRPPRQELMGGTYTITMKQGLPLKGKAVNEQGGERPGVWQPAVLIHTGSVQSNHRGLRHGQNTLGRHLLHPGPVIWDKDHHGVSG